MTDFESVDQMVNLAMKEFGKIDILFIGASMPYREPLVEMEIVDWEQVMDVYVKGILIPCSGSGDFLPRGSHQIKPKGDIHRSRGAGAQAGS